MKRLIFLLAAMAVSAGFAANSDACTGTSFTAQDGSRVVARTVEWAATPMQCGYAVVPRGHVQQSYTPSGENGLKYKAVYGYVGIYTEYEPFVGILTPKSSFSGINGINRAQCQTSVDKYL